MSILSVFKEMSEVKNVVIADTSGGLAEVSGEVDGERTAVRMAFVVNMLNEAGAQLGLGKLDRLFIQSTQASCFIALREDKVVTICIHPDQPTEGIEEKLDRSTWDKASSESEDLDDLEDEQDASTAVVRMYGKEVAEVADPFSRSRGVHLPRAAPPLSWTIRQAPSSGC